MNEHHNNLNKLFEIDNIKKVLDAGSGKASLSYLIKKYPNTIIDAIVYPGDNRKIDSIKENIKGNYKLIEKDICKEVINECYDLVLAHLLLGEATKFGNDYKDLVDKLLNINSNYFLIYDYKEDPTIDYDYLHGYIKDHDFAYVDSESFNKNEEQKFDEFIGKSYQAYLIRRLTITDIVFMYISGFINKNETYEKLKRLRIHLNTKKQKKDITLLIEKLRDLINENADNKIIIELLLNNETYLEIAKGMNAKDLLLMITRYIWSPSVPKINQSFFDEMVEIGIENNSLEKLWRLAFSYEHSNKNLDAIVDYYIKVKNSWYLSELVYAVGSDVDIKRLVKKLLNEMDKEFVKNFLDSVAGSGEIDANDIELLKESLF